MDILTKLSNDQRALKGQGPMTIPSDGPSHHIPPVPSVEQSESGHQQIAPSSLANEGDLDSDHNMEGADLKMMCSQCGMSYSNMT